MKVVTVLPDSSLLADVKALWRKNSDTLGMMPDGGFDDHAERKRILGLVDGSELQGYLMYRVSRNRANIVHLCVTESCRGKRASRILIEAEFMGPAVYSRKFGGAVHSANDRLD